MIAPAPPPLSLRLFLALWPDAHTRAHLLDWQQTQKWPAGARLTTPADLHLTLHFLGQVPQDRLVDLLQTLPPLGESALPLHLDTLEVWPNGVAALCPQAIPEPLHRLHQNLGRCLDALDLPRESRAYRPHVTLARKAHGLTATSRPAVPWQAHSYVLALSDRGYHVLHRWG